MTDKTPAQELLAAADRLDALLDNVDLDAWSIDEDNHLALATILMPHAFPPMTAFESRFEVNTPSDQIAYLIVAAVNASKHLPALLRDEGERLSMYKQSTQQAFVTGDNVIVPLLAIARAINGED